MCSSRENCCHHHAEFEPYFTSESGHFPFERIYTSAESGQLHDWITCNNNYNLECVSMFFLKRLYMYDCPYANVTAAIINLYNAYLERKPQDFYVTLKKPLVNVCDGVDYDHHYRSVYSAIARNDLIFLKVLVRYGVLSPDKLETPKEDLHYCLTLLDYRIGKIADRQLAYDLHEDAIVKYYRAIWNRLFLLYYKTLSNPELRNKLVRSQTAIMLIQEIIFPACSSVALAECFNLYFDATAESFVTVREIQELIDIPKQSLQFFGECRVEKCFNNLRSMFPDISDMLQPRSLQHLSRCAVRTHLTKMGVLPQVVSKLRIPNSIKEYILISKSGSQ